MHIFDTDQELFRAYSARRGEPQGCGIFGKATSSYMPHIYRGGSVIPGWGYSVERVLRGFIKPERAGNPAHVG